ncbi:MAG TPA: protein kinase [Myxococcales bacterium]|nr:protein kinase [Myxococcales bacterium]
MTAVVLGERYRLERELGRGGMGRVYVAHDLKLDRDVALKVLSPGEHDEQDIRRFEQEARAAGALEHPNVVAVHDIGTHQGAPYIISELLQGHTLRDALEGGPLPTATALDYARQLARGLAAAHAKGVVHRDLKPENLYVTEQGVLKILDFGIAKLAAAPAALAPSTDSGTLIGTVGYMAPEQVRAQSVDRRADLFAFGAILYEMLTGRRAFSGASGVETAYAVLNDEPPPLPDSVPRALQRIVRQCLAKDRDARFASAGDLEAALRAASPHSGKSRLLDVMLLLLGVGVAVGLWRSPLTHDFLVRLVRSPPPPIRQLAVLPFRAMGGGPDSEAFAAGLSEMLNNRLRQLEQFQGTLRVVSGNEVAREGIWTAREARRVFGATLALTGSVRWSGERVTVTSELVDTVTQDVIAARDQEGERNDTSALAALLLGRAADMLELELRPEARRALDLGTAPAPGAYEFYLQGRGYLQRFDRLENLEAALAVFDKALALDDRFVPAWAGRAEALLRKFERTKDSSLIPAARTSARRAIELDDRLAASQLTMGLLHRAAGEREEAIASFQRAMQLEPGSADAIRELGRAYDDAGRTQEAEVTFRRAIELRPDSWAAYKDLGLFYNRHGRIEDAIPPLRHVVDLTPDNYNGYANLAAMHLRLGRYADAAALLERSLSLNRSAPACSNLGMVYYFQKRYRDAAEMFLKAVELDPADDRTWGNYADALRYVPDKKDESVRAYREASAQVSKQLAVNPRNPELRSRLAMYEVFAGEKQAALREIEEALRAGREDGLVLFRSALVFEENGMRERALESIRGAIARGYSRAEIEQAPPLDSLRLDPRYPKGGGNL